MRMQPSQLAPLYPFQLVGNADATICGLWQGYGAWSPQVQPFPRLSAVLMPPADWFPTDEEGRCVDLAAYVEDAAGTEADLDPALEAGTIEYLLGDDQSERQ